MVMKSWSSSPNGAIDRRSVDATVGVLRSALPFPRPRPSTEHPSGLENRFPSVALLTIPSSLAAVSPVGGADSRPQGNRRASRFGRRAPSISTRTRARLVSSRFLIVAGRLPPASASAPARHVAERRSYATEHLPHLLHGVGRRSAVDNSVAVRTDRSQVFDRVDLVGPAEIGEG